MGGIIGTTEKGLLAERACGSAQTNAGASFIRNTARIAHSGTCENRRIVLSSCKFGGIKSKTVAGKKYC